jgi:hypothetical protein
MREIKFRAYYKKRMYEPVYLFANQWILVTPTCGDFYAGHYLAVQKEDKEISVEQFTGLKDKNGKGNSPASKTRTAKIYMRGI